MKARKCKMANRSRTRRCVLNTLGVVVLLLSTFCSHAQNFSIDWFTIDGGAGSSAGGQFALIGTIGQPDASPFPLKSADGRFTLQPAFLRGAIQAFVKEQRVFYNRSAWDGNDPAANALDDAAIATDKSALLPGVAASFSNYTSYPRGLNGLMVDIDGLEGALTPADFTFKMGNNSTPNSWASAPAPAHVAVRAEAGIDGSDRVTLIWNDNNLDAITGPNEAVARQWLEMTVLPTENTALTAPHTFCFGNAPGEAGNNAMDAKIDPADELLARANPRNALNPAPIDFDYDFNRDKRVDPADQLIARANPSNALNALKLISLGGGGRSVSQLGVARREMLVAIDFEANGRLVVQIHGEPGQSYSLERTDDLAPLQWYFSGVPTLADTNGLIRWSVSADPTVSRAFFRITNHAATDRGQR